MSNYFHSKESLHSVEEVMQILLSYGTLNNNTEHITLKNALGRVLAENVISSVNIPPCDNSAVDGYALNSKDFENKALNISERITAGKVANRLVKHSAVRIFTGAFIPEGADSVVMQENCIEKDGLVQIAVEPEAGACVRKQGEDVKIGATILTKGTRLRAQEIGFLASVGMYEVCVYAPLKVAILTTGNEIIEPGKILQLGQIYNTNRYTLLGLLSDMVVDILDFAVVGDTFEKTKDVLKKAASKADIIISTGGVSVGEEDYVKAALDEIGETTMWRVRMKPGKPFVFGRIEQTFFLGLPGNPVSVFVVFNLFVRPFLMQCGGQKNYQLQSYLVKADFDWQQKNARREYVRVRVHNYKASLYSNQSSGVLSSTIWADGLVCVLENSTVYKGDMVVYLPFSQWGSS